MSTPRDRTNMAPQSERPRFAVRVPDELAGEPDEPTSPLDLDAFERWADTGEGQPCPDE